jgi:hypothetical protein
MSTQDTDGKDISGIKNFLRDVGTEIANYLTSCPLLPIPAIIMPLLPHLLKFFQRF